MTQIMNERDLSNEMCLKDLVKDLLSKMLANEKKNTSVNNNEKGSAVLTEISGVASESLGSSITKSIEALARSSASRSEFLDILIKGLRIFVG